MQLLKTFIKLLLERGQGSQFGEDKIVAELLPKKGTYLDIGAYHPHLYSNTYLLYKKGWSGTAVEPNADMRLLWKVFRPRDTFVNCAMGKRGFLTYYRYGDGAYNGFQKIEGRPVKDAKQLEIRPLSDFLTSEVDFVNIDCEGMDYEILQTHDWIIKPKVIAIEGEEGGEAHHFLLSKGYQLASKAGMSLIFKF